MDSIHAPKMVDENADGVEQAARGVHPMTVLYFRSTNIVLSLHGASLFCVTLTL
mgnify:CR=1 FL=1|jgi:hypothetical protein